jgi:hypothetical protein
LSPILLAILSKQFGLKLLGLQSLHAYQLKLHQLYLKGLLLSMCVQWGTTKGAVGRRHSSR